MTDTLDIVKQSLYSTKISRMLAQENLNVEFDSTASTASFRPDTRTLTFPHSTAFMDSDVHELFMMHEVSHALHLPVNTMELVKASGVEHDLFNIVIDIRDERLIKEKFPGSVPVMNRGYEKLLEQGFFGDRSALNLRRFSDRLNTYAKLGMKNAHFIKMNAEELEFYVKCMQAETVEQCIALAKELDDLNSKFVVDELDILEFLQRSGKIDTDDEEQNTQLQLDESIEKFRNERVQEMFDDAFKSSVLKNAVVYNVTVIPESLSMMTTAKQFTDYISKFYSLEWNIESESIASMTANVRNMRKDIRQSVDGMVRVFESKKAAERYKNIQISDTGSIDFNKIHRYQFDDKIFRKSAKMPNSKNHAYYIMLDFSGSMHNIMDAVIEQIVVLTEFLRRIQVPYKVVAFGAGIKFHSYDEHTYSYQNVLGSLAYDNSLKSEVVFEVMNSSQTLLEHNLSILGLINRCGYSLGGTPTAACMFKSEHIASKFFKQCGTSSNHMVVITDGEPTDMIDSYTTRGKTKIYVDPVTKRNIVMRGNASYSAINAIGKVFEYRYNWKFTTISLVKTLQEKHTSAFVSSGISDDMNSSWRKNGFAIIIDPYTKNPVYMAKPFGIESDLSDFSVENKKTSSQISRSMIKNLKGIKKSRSFLNALAENLS